MLFDPYYASLETRYAVHDQLSRDVFACDECYRAGLLARLEEFRQRNREMAYRFRPARVELLFIAESPPVSGAYFYRLPEWGQRGVRSALFWETVRALGIVPAGPCCYAEKERYLAKFRDRGLFIVDAAKCPVNHVGDGTAARMIGRCSRLLRREVQALDPRHIVLIKKTNHVLLPRLEEWGFSPRLLSAEPLAFPVAGNQGRFRAELAVLRAAYPRLRQQLGSQACPSHSVRSAVRVRP